ncbi:MAG: Rpn family recombination-promoting nuclease/putative transposase [Chthoniobacterales bacterium]|nr:Rpn family recombination-promoting nuclease/putative transposase [Chthoniobacterales bacterium]
MKPKKLIQFDWAIKTLLRNKSHFPILEGFLSELLHTDVKIESLLESESNKKHAQDKSNRVDVLAQLKSGEKVIIEVQCAHQWDFFSRMLYGVSKVVAEHLKEGEEYGTMPRVISVNIVYFDLGHGEDYIYHGTTDFKGVHKKDILQLSPKEKEHYPARIDHVSKVFPEYYVLKVSEFDLKIKDTLDEWIYALQQSEVRPEFKAQGIQKAAEQLSILQLSESDRIAYERYVGDNRDAKSVWRTYYSDGKREGKAEMIHNLYRLGLPLEQIATAAQLLPEQIEEILKSEI